MDVRQINEHLIRGDLTAPGLFPHLDILKTSPWVFEFDFGLDVLPEEPGVLIIRGPRQVGKSTWLEKQLKETVERFGPGSALYLNGDELASADDLVDEARDLLPLISVRHPARLFIDEITAIRGWESGIKRLADAGDLRGVLVVTIGSCATDLRRGSERLPGRKGKLDRTDYLFLPVSFVEFQRRCGDQLGPDTLDAYLLTGGSPVACVEVAQHRRLPEYVVTMVRDWILGDVARGGRSRASLLSVMQVLHRFGGTPVGQAKLAREAGLANNTVAAGYLELLADLLCLGISPAWDSSRRVTIARKPAKFPFINLLAAVTWSPSRLRTIDEVKALALEQRGRWTEWLVAQELWRRSALAGADSPERLPFWQGRQHEVDFVVCPDLFIEVKHGRASPLEFTWFLKSFPGVRLVVVNAEPFEAGSIRGVTTEQFLSNPEIIA